MALFDWLSAGAAAASAGSAIYGASQAGNAADAQVGATQDAIAEQRRQYDINRADLAPYRAVGVNSLLDFATATGSDYTKSPGYDFRMSEGLKAINRGAASRGALNSGATDKALIRYSQGLAADDYNTWMNRKAAQAGIGQTATNAGVMAGNATAGNIGNALIQGGQARASGYANEYNALAGGANSLASLAGMYARR
jgi:hypothetical protein